MLNLIRKDLILQKYLIIFYLIIFIVYLQFEINFIISVIMVTSLFVMNSHYYDEKSKAVQLINSLPYSKKEIVSSKYIEAILATLIVVAIGFIIQLVSQTSFKISFFTVMGCLAGTMIFTGIYLPIFYKFKQQYLLVIASIGIIVIIVYMPKVINFFITNYAGQIDYLKNISNLELYGYLTIGSLVIYSLSWLASLKIYSKKAF